MNAKKITGISWGILALCGLVLGFIPCVGWFNWFNIPFSIIGLAVNSILFAMTKDDSKMAFVAGGICCLVAMGFGIVRLVLGAGVV